MTVRLDDDTHEKLMQLRQRFLPNGMTQREIVTRAIIDFWNKVTGGKP